MKNSIKGVSLIILILSFFMYGFLQASTNTTPRTEENLQIRESLLNKNRARKAALITPKVDESEKIYDFAHILSESEETALFLQISNYIEQNKMDMVVVTIDKNNKSSAMDYADDFYDYNYFGIGSTNDGILLLIDMDNRVVWISTTGEAQRIYDDNRIDRMLDVVQPKLTSGRYQLAVEEFIQYADQYVKMGVPNTNKNTYIDKNGEYKIPLKEFIPMGLFVGSIITIIIIVIGVMSHKNVKKATRAKYYLQKDSVKITEKNDMFVNSRTTSVRIDSDSYGGGSSTHHSSSGTSHGGGGRSF